MHVAAQITLIICFTLVLITLIGKRNPPTANADVKGDKPTPEQKKLMDAAFFSSADWLVQKDSPTFLCIVDRQTGKIQFIPKDGTIPIEK